MWFKKPICVTIGLFETELWGVKTKEHRLVIKGKPSEIEGLLYMLDKLVSPKFSLTAGQLVIYLDGAKDDFRLIEIFKRLREYV